MKGALEGTVYLADAGVVALVHRRHRLSQQSTISRKAFRTTTSELPHLAKRRAAARCAPHSDWATLSRAANSIPLGSGRPQRLWR